MSAIPSNLNEQIYKCQTKYLSLYVAYRSAVNYIYIIVELA